MEIVRVVKARMQELRLTTAGLSRLLDGKVKQRTLYAFMQGDPLNATALSHVLDALGLGVYPHEWVSQSVRNQEAVQVNARLKQHAAWKARLEGERADAAKSEEKERRFRESLRRKARTRHVPAKREVGE